jgi:hypothetical protein
MSIENPTLVHFRHFSSLITNEIRSTLSAIRYFLPRNPRLKSAISAFSAVKNSCLCVFCAFLWLKNPRNPCNPWLINDLRPWKSLYNCREDSTTIESSLQNNLFMQNKANFQKVKFDINQVLTMNYVHMDTWLIRKTKPIQSQLKPIQSQSKPKQTQFKPKQTQFQSAHLHRKLP